MRDVFVAGAAMTHFGKFPDRGVRSLTEEAVGGAPETFAKLVREDYAKFEKLVKELNIRVQ